MSRPLRVHWGWEGKRWPQLVIEWATTTTRHWMSDDDNSSLNERRQQLVIEWAKTTTRHWMSDDNNSSLNERRQQLVIEWATTTTRHWMSDDNNSSSGGGRGEGDGKRSPILASSFNAWFCNGNDRTFENSRYLCIYRQMVGCYWYTRYSNISYRNTVHVYCVNRKFGKQYWNGRYKYLR